MKLIPTITPEQANDNKDYEITDSACKTNNKRRKLPLQISNEPSSDSEILDS